MFGMYVMLNFEGGSFFASLGGEFFVVAQFQNRLGDDDPNSLDASFAIGSTTKEGQLKDCLSKFNHHKVKFPGVCELLNFD